MTQEFTPFQIEWCQRQLEKLNNMKISAPFKQPILNTEQSSDYLEVIAKPIGIDQISEKLQKYDYRKFLDFVTDLRLVFNNAMKYYEPTDHYHLMAKELSNWFENKLNKFPQTQNEKYLNLIRKVLRKVDKLIKTAPNFDPGESFYGVIHTQVPNEQKT